MGNGIKIQVYEENGKIVRTQIEKSGAEYYIFDHERRNNSIRTLISLNYTYKENNRSEEQTNNNNESIGEGYQVIEGSAPTQTPPVEEPEPLTITIKNIELAKETTNTRK